jgi:hypothetical protein
VLDVDGPEDAVELELLVVHVAPEVVVADASVAVAVAGAEQLPHVLALGGHLQRRQAGLDLCVVEVPAPRGVEEGEHVADPRLPLVLRLSQREQHVLHGDGPRLPHRLAAPARPRRGCGHGGRGGEGRGGTAPGVHRVSRRAGHGAGGGRRRWRWWWVGLVSGNGRKMRESSGGGRREGIYDFFRISALFKK